MPARRDSRRPLVVAIMVATAVVLGIVFGPSLWRNATTEEPAPDRGAPPVVAVFEGVDLRRVHLELLPAWVIAQSDPGAHLQEERAFEALRAALEPSASLAELMTSLREHTRPPRLHHEADREQAMALVTRWNRELDEAGIPYMLRANIMESGQVIRFYALCYEVVEESRIAVADDEYRVRFLRRVDRINLKEWILGIGSGAGAGRSHHDGQRARSGHERYLAALEP